MAKSALPERECSRVAKRRSRARSLVYDKYAPHYSGDLTAWRVYGASDRHRPRLTAEKFADCTRKVPCRWRPPA